MLTTGLLVLLFHLELGYMPMDNWRCYDPLALINNTALYINMDAELDAFDGLLFIGGYCRTNMLTTDKLDEFWPHTMTYGFRAGLRPFGGFEIGFRHMCTHPVIAYMMNTAGRFNYEGAYEEFYVKFSGSFTLIGGDK